MVKVQSGDALLSNLLILKIYRLDLNLQFCHCFCLSDCTCFAFDVDTCRLQTYDYSCLAGNCSLKSHFNSLPNDRILDWSKLKAICSRQIKCNSEPEICFGKGRKYCGKRRKCWLLTFSPFPTMFSKGLFVRVVQSRDCVVKVNPFPNKPCFIHVYSTGPLKTLWEKEKLLVTSNFSFSHIISTRLENFLSFSSSLKTLSVWKSLKFVVWEKVKV